MQTKNPVPKKLADRRDSGNPQRPNAPFPPQCSQLISTPAPVIALSSSGCFISVHISSASFAQSSILPSHSFPPRKHKSAMSWLFGSSKGVFSRFFSASLRQNYTHGHLFQFHSISLLNLRSNANIIPQALPNRLPVPHPPSKNPPRNPSPAASVRPRSPPGMTACCSRKPMTPLKSASP